MIITCRSVCFSSDGKKIASGSWDKTVRVWNLETGECIKTFEGHNDVVRSVCFSSDGKKIASGGGYYDKTVRVWNVETGECIKTFEGHNDVARSVCFSSDGKKIASGSCDKTVRVWHVETGECTWSGEDLNASPLSAEEVKYFRSKSDQFGGTIPFTPDTSSYSLYIHDNAGCIIENKKTVHALKYIRVDDPIITK